MKNFISRYLRRGSFKLQCVTVTPMFLGNADQGAEWRGEPFKALLRYWWRVSQRRLPEFQRSGNHDLLQKESELFGFAGDVGQIKAVRSMVQVEVEGTAPPTFEPPPRLSKIDHPEVQRAQCKVDPLLYLGGMGLMTTRGKVTHSYFSAGSRFTVKIHYPKDQEQDLKPVMALIQAFGAIGARCRNGWGSFQLLDDGLSPHEASQSLNGITCDWKKGFDKDYPNCLGRDDAGPLLWKTAVQDTWAFAMREFAQAYAWLRAGDSAKGIPRLNPDRNNDPADRHLLGFPLTNHGARGYSGWGRDGRHGSPLRFIVRKKGTKFQGFVLHLPHAHSTRMQLPNYLNSTSGQINVWERVHGSLEKLLVRAATYKECL